MTLKEAIKKDDQRHLYVKSPITSGITQYLTDVKKQNDKTFTTSRIVLLLKNKVPVEKPCICRVHL